MKSRGLRQKPQVKCLSRLRLFYLLGPTYFYSYQALMRLFVLEPTIHVAMMDTDSCFRMPMLHSSYRGGWVSCAKPYRYAIGITDQETGEKWWRYVVTGTDLT